MARLLMIAATTAPSALPTPPTAGWDVALVGGLSLLLGLGVGAALFWPRLRARRAPSQRDRQVTLAAAPVAARPVDLTERQSDQMHRMNAAFARQLATQDPQWNPDLLHARVAECFMASHKAWTERNPLLADRHMSKALYDRRKRQTDHQLALGKRDVVKDLKLLDVDLVFVSDREGKKNDEFWAIVTGSMVTYDEIADWEKYRLAAGAMTEDDDLALQLEVAKEYAATRETTRTRELWKFLRDGDAWMLDAISHDLTEVDDMPRPLSDDVYEER